MNTLRLKGIFKSNFLQKQEKFLFVILFALECWRFCFLRMSFWYSVSLEIENPDTLIFILYCLGVVLGMIASSLYIKKNNTKNFTAIFRFCVIFAVVLSISSMFLNGYLALVLEFLTFFFIAASTGLTLNYITLKLRFNIMGRFIGFCFALLSFTGSIFISLNSSPVYITIPVMLLFPLLALIFFSDKNINHEQPACTELKLSPNPPKTLVLKCLFIIILYCFIAGALDSIYFFNEAFINMPNFFLYTVIYSCIIYIVSGFLFDKANWYMSVTISLLFVCLGQSLSFFSENAILVLPYMLLTGAGSITLEAFITILPVYYAKKINAPYVSQIGYICLYSGYLITALLFEFIPSTAHTNILGAMLVLALIIMVCVIIISNQASKLKENSYEKNLDKSISRARTEYNLTSREAEILNLLYAGKTNSEIALMLFISENTVKFHVKNLLKKLNISNRHEVRNIINSL